MVIVTDEPSSKRSEDELCLTRRPFTMTRIAQVAFARLRTIGVRSASTWQSSAGGRLIS